MLDQGFHLIPKINLFLLFDIHTHHSLHPRSLIIDVLFRPSVVVTSKLSSPHKYQFKYNPSGHVATGYLNIRRNDGLRKILSKVQNTTSHSL